MKKPPTYFWIFFRRPKTPFFLTKGLTISSILLFVSFFALNGRVDSYRSAYLASGQMSPDWIVYCSALWVLWFAVTNVVALRAWYTPRIILPKKFSVMAPAINSENYGWDEYTQYGKRKRFDGISYENDCKAYYNQWCHDYQAFRKSQRRSKARGKEASFVRQYGYAQGARGVEAKGTPLDGELQRRFKRSINEELAEIYLQAHEAGSLSRGQGSAPEPLSSELRGVRLA